MKRYQKIFKESSPGLDNIDISIADKIFKAFDKKLLIFNNKYKDVDYGSTSISSAPDTSKFRSTKSGFVKIEKDVTINFSGFSVVCQYCLQIGSLVDKKIKDKILKEYKNIINSILIPLKFNENNKNQYINENADISVSIRESYGSNYSQYGISISNIYGKVFYLK